MQIEFNMLTHGLITFILFSLILFLHLWKGLCCISVMFPCRVLHHSCFICQNFSAQTISSITWLSYNNSVYNKQAWSVGFLTVIVTIEEIPYASENLLHWESNQSCCHIYLILNYKLFRNIKFTKIFKLCMYIFWHCFLSYCSVKVF